MNDFSRFPIYFSRTRLSRQIPGFALLLAVLLLVSVNDSNLTTAAPVNSSQDQAEIDNSIYWNQDIFDSRTPHKPTTTVTQSTSSASPSEPLSPVSLEKKAPSTQDALKSPHLGTAKPVTSPSQTASPASLHPAPIAEAKTSPRPSTPAKAPSSATVTLVNQSTSIHGFKALAMPLSPTIPALNPALNMPVSIAFPPQEKPASTANQNAPISALPSPPTPQAYKASEPKKAVPDSQSKVTEPVLITMRPITPPENKKNLAPIPFEMGRTISPTAVTDHPAIIPDKTQAASAVTTTLSTPSPGISNNTSTLAVSSPAQTKAKEYQQMLARWLNSQQSSAETILNKGQEAVSEILKSADELNEPAWQDIVRNMQGYTLMRDNIIAATPDPTYFLTQSKLHGKPVDVAFFTLMSRTLNAYWPMTMEQLQDLSGCTRFGSHDLVTLYGAWKEFQKHYGAAYQTALNDPNLLLLWDIEDQLLNSQAACDGPESVQEELSTFIHTYPQSDLTPKLKKRLENLQKQPTEMVYNQSIRHQQNP